MHTPAPVETPKVTERLRELVTESGLAGVEFARRVGVSHQSLHLYLRGYRVPRAATAQRIADACGVEVAWLLGGDA
ncbi:helix-turn-helix domain-containing protein [Amycolatopsis dongchuanensis]|uniref:HTH cro/C1-type domain-containing protein n=1 Tax=Amycolatopsis dongchuanensis TaxID=1070866 RepID=A0ABP9Q5J0_9PSEU